MQVSRDNHYVPQLYLNNWGTNKKVFVHRLLVPHEKYPVWELRSIQNTAYIDNLYVRMEDGNEYDDFEVDFNKQFETPVKPVLDKVCKEQKMTSVDWKILCDYVAAQFVRTPSFYHLVAEWGKRTVPDIMESVLQVIASSPSIQSTRSSSGEKNNLIPLEINLSKRDEDKDHTYLEARTIVGKNLWLYVINHALSTDSVLKREFASRKWSIATAPDGIIWPTCDAPVVIAGMDRYGNLYNTDGFNIADRVIVFPVSPQKVLLATHKRIHTWRFKADRNLAQQIKEAIVNNASMYIYSSREDSEVAEIRNRLVDETEFRRQQTQFKEWYDMYKTDEAPLLTTRRKILHT